MSVSAKQYILKFILIACLVLPPRSIFAQPMLSNLSYKLQDKQVYHDYEVRIFRDDEFGEGYFEVFQKNKLIYKQEGFKFRIGLVYADEDLGSETKGKGNELVAMGKDITGKGIPNLVVSEWTGGAHCCFYFYVFEIGKHFRKIAKLDAGHGDLSHFEDLNGDNRLEFITADWTFAYWRAPFAQSPAPEIILTFRNSTYQLAADLMCKPQPNAKEIEDKAREIQSDASLRKGHPPVALWSYMLDLIYTGNAETAWQFSEIAWASKVPGKEEFLRDFQAQLAKSPYWRQIDRMSRAK